jgi:GNAT superfamily N-acetyltransferase
VLTKVAAVTDHAVVVRAAEKDLSTLVALRYQWRVNEEGESGRTLEEFGVEFREWYAEHRSTHIGYLSCIDDVAVGCAWLFVVDRVPGPGRFVRRSGMLQSVYVQPDLRSTGIGTQMVRFIIDEAHAMDLDYLMVHPSTASFDFYRRLGFNESGKVLELRFA